LEGDIASIPQSNKKMKEVYYNLTLRLLNTNTGVYEWQDEKEITKQEKR
jgi:PBP1b-binding outer membrane lipoprotein LpoB